VDGITQISQTTRLKSDRRSSVGRYGSRLYKGSLENVSNNSKRPKGGEVEIESAPLRGFLQKSNGERPGWEKSKKNRVGEGGENRSHSSRALIDSKSQTEVIMEKVS